MLVLVQEGKTPLAEDREFHQRLFKNVGNQVLLKLLDIFWIVFRKVAQHADVMDTKPMSTYRDHVAIVDAIKAKDEVAARAALERHYDKHRYYESLMGRLERLKRERRGEWKVEDAASEADAMA
jgi:DNA-binding FadR family transcriptional regulator